VRHILLHHHIFKNAGTTLDFIFWRNFDEQYVTFHGIETESTGIVDGAQLRGFLRANPSVVGVSSHHFHTQPFREGDGEEFTGEFRFLDMVLLRHPIDRLVSIYDFFRSGGGGDPQQSALVEQLTLREWLELMIERSPHLVNDAQVGLLAKYGRYVAPPAPVDLQRAKERLSHLALVGTVEQFDDACICAEYFLRPAFGALDFAYVSENVSRVRSGSGRGSRIERLEEILGPSLFRRLTILNELDIELWRAATDEVVRRLAYLENVERRRETFRERCRDLATKVQAVREAEAAALAESGDLSQISYDALRPAQFFWRQARNDAAPFVRQNASS
jgi:hypothetical protein